jgi:putative molybdopterin biosynthesis protein
MATIEATGLEKARKARNLSQRALAEAANISRQAIGAIEAGRMQPSVQIALALARALGTTVEQLFATSAPPSSVPQRSATGTVDGRLVVHPLEREHLAVEPAIAEGAVFVAGCDVAVGMLARHATLRARDRASDARAVWLSMTNRAALDALLRRQVHAAVVHHAGAKPARLKDTALERFEIAVTEEGWLLAHGNPLGLRNAADLVRKRARLVNRPLGAGARALLDAQLRRGAVVPQAVAGYTTVLPGQLDVGRAIAQNFADAAVGAASVARIHGLDFTPLREERCMLLVRRSELQSVEIRLLLETLRSLRYRADLEALSCYDLSRSGEQIA